MLTDSVTNVCRCGVSFEAPRPSRDVARVTRCPLCSVQLLAAYARGKGLDAEVHLIERLHRWVVRIVSPQLDAPALITDTSDLTYLMAELATTGRCWKCRGKGRATYVGDLLPSRRGGPPSDTNAIGSLAGRTTKRTGTCPICAGTG